MASKSNSKEVNISEKARRNIVWNCIFETFRYDVEKLNNLYSHTGIKGDANEKVLINFLRSFLPGRYQIEKKNVLLDKNGVESKEQDIIIWDSISHPRIFTGTKFFLMESVLATIQVSTTLDQGKLEKDMCKIQHLRRLEHFKRVTGDKDKQVHPPLCYIFAYNMGWKKRKSLIKNVEKICIKKNILPHERFDYLFVMRKGAILTWDHKLKAYPILRPITNFKEKYRELLPINDRWPQFFPSKLIKNEPIVLSEKIIKTDSSKFQEKVYKDLSIEGQIIHMLDFLRNLCLGLENQKSFHSHNILKRSYSKNRKSKRNYSDSAF